MKYKAFFRKLWYNTLYFERAAREYDEESPGIAGQDA